MQLTYDPFGNAIKPPMYLGEVDAATINGVPNYDLHGTFRFNDVSEISFKSPARYTDGFGDDIESPVYSKLNLFRKIKLNGFGVFEITDCEEVTDGVSIYKSITARSAENEFTRKKVTLEINMGTETSIDSVVLYNPHDKEHSLMHLVMSKLPHWSYGYVDPALASRQRSFDIEDRDVYSFLNQDVAKTFGIIFTYDTDNEIINIYDAETVGDDTDVFISAENLAEQINAEANTDDIVTKCRVVGSDGLNAREYNLGQDYIVDISYFLDNQYMPQELVDKYKAYLDTVNTRRPEYEELLEQLDIATVKYQDIYNKMPSSTSSTDWSEYGMAGLKSKQKEYENIVSVEINAGHADKDNIYYDRYLQYYNTLEAIKAEIVVRQGELDAQQKEIDNINEQMATISEEIDMSNNFTEDEIYILQRFEYEGEYSDDCFLITDDEGIESILETKRALYEAAAKWLHNVSRPQYNFSMDLGNLLALPEFEPLLKGFVLGNYILIQMREDYLNKVRLNEITINFEDFSDFRVTFGNMFRLDDPVDKVADALDQSSTTSNTVSNNKSYWQSAIDASTEFNNMMQEGLNTSLVNIKLNNDSEILVNGMGIICQKKDPDTGVYDRHMTIITPTGIYFSDDSMQSLKAALGEITVGEMTSYGLIAQAVFAGLIKGTRIEGGDIYGTVMHAGTLGEEGVGWTLDAEGIYNGKDSYSSTAKGIYLGATEVNMYDNFKVDRNGRVTIEATSLSITGKGGTSSSFDDYIDSEVNDSIDKTRTLVAQLSNDFQSIPVDSDGNYSYFPECKTQISVFFGSMDISASATYEIEESSGITGSWNLASQTYTVSDLTEDTGWVDITASYQSLSVTKRFSISKQYSGKDGSNGVGVKSVDVWYYLSSSPTALTGGNWSTNAPTWSDDKYIWTKTIVTYTDNSTLESKPACITGNQGTDGENGVGIDSIIEEYYQSTSATELKDGQWQTTPPEWVSGKYIWTRSTIHYTNGTSVTTDPVNSTGADGKDGNGVKSITEEYYQSTSATAQIGGSWSTTYPGWQKGTYIWTRSVIEYTDGGSKVTSPICVSGTDGVDGEGGTGIESVDVEYYQSTSSSSLSGGSWSTTAPTWVNGKYIWSRTKTVYTDGRTEYSDPACITGQKGENGADGAAGRTYFIEASASVIKKGADNVLSPSSITFYLYYRDGQSASRTAYYGRMKIQETINGSTTTRYTSYSDESSATYSPSASATNITCTMYASGGTTTTLDIQSVAILKDIDNLTREEVFNIWTDNGRVQGLFMDDNGYLYFNGEYVQSHTITAEQIESGTITAEQIASGTITADKIASGAITADMITTGTLDANKVTIKNLDADNINTGTIRTDYRYLIRSGTTGSYFCCIDSSGYPSSTGTVNIGMLNEDGSTDSSYPYIRFYTSFSSDTTIGLLSEKIELKSGATIEAGSATFADTGDIYPNGTSYDLGTSRSYWKTGYFNTLRGSNSLWLYGNSSDNYGLELTYQGVFMPNTASGISLGQNYKPFHTLYVANGVQNTSIAEAKENIREMHSVIDSLLSTNVCEYTMTQPYSKTKDIQKRYGFVIGDDYNVPYEILGPEGNTIDSYNTDAFLFKCLQETYSQLCELKSKVEKLEEQLNGQTN